MDGSPQGRTAWLTEPYLPNGFDQAEGYTAYPTVDAQFYQAATKTLLENKVQALSHANGDAAIDLMLNALEQGLNSSADLDHRSVIIHAQLMRKDQIATAKKLSAIPSFSRHILIFGAIGTALILVKNAQTI